MALRVRTAPGQRSGNCGTPASVRGLLGTSIGERWERLPVDAERVIEPSGRSYIAIDRERLGAVLRSHDVATAKPAPMEARRPQNGEGEDDDNTGGRKRRGHRDSPRPLVEGEVLRPPAQDSDPADSTKSGDESPSGEATPAPQLAKPYKPPHELPDEEIDKIAKKRSSNMRTQEAQRGAKESSRTLTTIWNSFATSRRS